MWPKSTKKCVRDTSKIDLLGLFWTNLSAAQVWSPMIFFSAGSLWSLEFCRTKNEQFWANLEGIFKNCHHFTHKSVQKCNFGFYSITGNYTNEIRLKVCQKSNISEEKNMVANFGFNCKNGKFSPILRLHAITRVRVIFLGFIR